MAPIFHTLRGIYRGKTQGALRGAAALFRQAKKARVKGVTLDIVKKFLEGEEVYFKHRRVKKNFERRKIEAPYGGFLLQADIWDLTKYRESNTHLYALVATDSFTKFLSVAPLKNRGVDEVERGMQSLLLQSPFIWEGLLFDCEGAVFSKRMAAWFKKKNIKLMRTKSRVKAPQAESYVEGRPKKGSG